MRLHCQRGSTVTAVILNGRDEEKHKHKDEKASSFRSLVITGNQPLKVDDDMVCCQGGSKCERDAVAKMVGTI